MPARVARSSVTRDKPATKRKRNQKRALDAFSIATEQEPERVRVRQHRLGESEGDAPRRKRQRLEDDDGSDEAPSEPQRQQRKNVNKGRFDELDVSEGSDSEGNNWRMGEVDEDDDSDIDSDDAFGESDEERFEGFTFRGSSSNQPKAKRRKPAGADEDGALDLEDGEEAAEDDDEDSLGEDAVDLATMLDNYEDTEEEDAGSDEGSDSDVGSRDGRDYNEGLSKLGNFVSALPLDEAQDGPSRRARPDPSVRPGDGSNRPKLSMDAFVAADENVKSMIPSFKQAKRYTSGKAVEVPIPERQRAKLEREAADKKAKETLERWVDTVKQNRRAEHISFPLVEEKAADTLGARKLLPPSRQTPTTDLEKAIANIMQQSGLVTDASQQEQQLQEFEELQMNKLPIEEVQNRRAALRQARDLMFREEIKAKRVKKIKSKAYRRVHRKERERQAMRDADAFGEGEMNDEDRERLDRQRAEERMGAKHRESKWAKAVKKTGQAAWDDDARDGMTDMARRNDELRRRQQGKTVTGSDHDTASEDSMDEEDNYSDDEAARKSFKQSLDKLDLKPSGKRSGISEMKFMKDAEATKRRQNEEDIERLRRELNGEDPFAESNDDDRVVGRRQYGPQAKQAKATDGPSQSTSRSEFEAKDPASSDDEAEIILDQAARKHEGNTRTKSKLPVQPNIQAHDRKASQSKAHETSESDTEEQNPFLIARKPKGANRRKAQSPVPVVELLPGEVHSKPDADGFTTVTYTTTANSDNEQSSENEEEAEDVPTLSRQQQLFRQAFAGDDTFEDFAKEKKQLAVDDDDKVVDNSMPGWGSWTGASLPKREKRMASSLRQRLQTVQKGVRPEDRKDAKLKNVIFSEKRVKKNGAYLASTLPFPFSTREEYERSMRMPVGGEWNTKGTVQKNVMPRVLVKPGRVITPLEAPML